MLDVVGLGWNRSEAPDSGQYRQLDSLQAIARQDNRRIAVSATSLVHDSSGSMPLRVLRGTRPRPVEPQRPWSAGTGATPDASKLVTTPRVNGAPPRAANSVPSWWSAQARGSERRVGPGLNHVLPITKPHAGLIRADYASALDQSSASSAVDPSDS